jgi:organic radical activating enzyme
MKGIVGNMLPLMEQFYTLQGEGRYSGKPAVFIRLAGCDVGCVWCDVKESWDEAAHPLVPINTIVDEVLKTGCSFVVITGGEPTLYDLTELTLLLSSKNIEIAIETSGTNQLKGHFDWVTFSPKKFKKPLNEFYSNSNELKVVVFHISDLEWAKNHADKISGKCDLYLQPEWSKMDVLMPEILDFIKQNPQWNLSLQTHKFIDIP